MTTTPGAATMSEAKTYNGWTNYETWAVNLWIDNEQSTQEYWLERAEYWHKAASTSEYWTPAESAKFNLADELKESVEAEQPEAVNGTMYADLLMAALSEVNWQEIAQNLLSEFEGAV